MTDIHGLFCWYELMAGDSAAARTFYGDAVGWGAEPAPVGDKSYTLFTDAGRPVAGLMDMPEDCRRVGLPPAWTGYVAVDDVDASAALAASLGAVVRVPATDIPDIGRFAVLSDPQGALIALFKPQAGSGGPTAPDAPGAIAWHELHSTDWPAAFAFYHRLFGWEKAEAMDMGEMGSYQMVAAQGRTIGAMFTPSPAPARPMWLFYLSVADIDAAAARALAKGATLLFGPMAVPGGGWIVQARDPQGALFALHGPRS